MSDPPTPIFLRYFAVPFGEHWRIYDIQEHTILSRSHTRVTAQTGAYRLNAAIAENRREAQIQADTLLFNEHGEHE